jgi:tetratricopeptide (TPR) repeat protein
VEGAGCLSDDEIEGAHGRAPRRRNIAAAIGVTATAAAIAAVVVLGRSDAYTEERTAATQQIAVAWSPARAQALAQAFARTAKPTAADNAAIAIRQLDVYRAEWLADRLDAWAATHRRDDQSSQVLARRLACFDQLAETMAELVALFIAGDPRDVQYAPQIVYRLPPTSTCRPERLAARSPAPSGPDGERADRALRELEVLQLADHHAEVQQRAQAAIDDADRRGDAVILARARFILGTAQSNSGNYPAAEATLHLAAQDAAVARDYYLVAESWLRMLAARRVDLDQPDAMPTMILAATAAVAQAGNDPRQQADLAMTLGSLAAAGGNRATARDQLVLARERRIAALGPDHPSVANDEKNLGAALAALGDYEEATRHYERGLEIARAALGPRHPQVSQLEQNVADLANQRKDWSAAERHARAAIAIDLVVRGPDHPFTAHCHVILAHALREQHRLPEARAELASARVGYARIMLSSESSMILDVEEAEIARLEDHRDEARPTSAITTTTPAR